MNQITLFYWVSASFDLLYQVFRNLSLLNEVLEWFQTFKNSSSQLSVDSKSGFLPCFQDTECALGQFRINYCSLRCFVFSSNLSTSFGLYLEILDLWTLYQSVPVCLNSHDFVSQLRFLKFWFTNSDSFESILNRMKHYSKPRNFPKSLTFTFLTILNFISFTFVALPQGFAFRSFWELLVSFHLDFYLDIVPSFCSFSFNFLLN
jgi:hypothetical protein